MMTRFFCFSKYIYVKQLELKLEYQVEHATFMDLDIKIEDDIFLYNFFDKKEKFSFLNVGTPYLSVEQYSVNNIL